GDLRPARGRRGQVRGRGERHRVDRGEEPLMTWSLPVDLTLIILLALAFDYTNGFHDAANSIATVVSTRVLSPRWAVLWAAFFNFAAFILGKVVLFRVVFGTHVASTIAKDVVSQNGITIGVVFAGL